MKKKKILMVGSDSTVKGGISNVILQILSFDLGPEFKVSFIATHTNGSIVKRCFIFVKAYLKILTKLVMGNVDIIHMHMSYKGSFYRKYLLCLMCYAFKAKTIIHMHGGAFEDFYENADRVTKKLVRYMLRKSDRVLVLGRLWEECVKKIEPCTKVEILYNSLKTPEKLEGKSEKVKILFLGILSKGKGVWDLLEVISELNEDAENPMDKVVFYFGGIGKEKQRMEQYINKQNISMCVKLSGWIEDEKKEKMLQECSIFVLPSYKEAFPVAILEAMSFGMAILSTDVGSVREMVEDKKNGYLIQPGDKAKLKSHLESLIKDNTIRDKMGENSREIAMKYFDEKQYQKKLQILYRKIEVEND